MLDSGQIHAIVAFVCRTHLFVGKALDKTHFSD